MQGRAADGRHEGGVRELGCLTMLRGGGVNGQGMGPRGWWGGQGGARPIRLASPPASPNRQPPVPQEYHKLLVQRLKEQRERRSESLAKKRALRQASVASKEAPAAAAAPKA